MGGAESCLVCDGKRTAENVRSDRKLLTSSDLANIRANSSGEVQFSGKSAASVASANVTSTCEEGMSKVGVGAYFQRSKDDPNNLVVKAVLRGSPAATGGTIKVGDTILTVDGESVYGCSLAGLADKLLGHPGTKVDLTFSRLFCDNSTREYSVTLLRGLNCDSITVRGVRPLTGPF